MSSNFVDIGWWVLWRVSMRKKNQSAENKYQFFTVCERTCYRTLIQFGLCQGTLAASFTHRPYSPIYRQLERRCSHTLISPFPEFSDKLNTPSSGSPRKTERTPPSGQWGGVRTYLCVIRLSRTYFHSLPIFSEMCVIIFYEIKNCFSILTSNFVTFSLNS